MKTTEKGQSFNSLLSTELMLIAFFFKAENNYFNDAFDASLLI